MDFNQLCLFDLVLDTCVIFFIKGGIRAVIWNDVFQAVVMLGGLVAVLIVGVHKVGGFGNVWDSLEKGQRLHFFK